MIWNHGRSGSAISTISGPATPPGGNVHHILGHSYSSFIQDDFEVTHKSDAEPGFALGIRRDALRQHRAVYQRVAEPDQHTAHTQDRVVSTTEFLWGATEIGRNRMFVHRLSLCPQTITPRSNGVPLPTGVYVNAINSADAIPPALGQLCSRAWGLLGSRCRRTGLWCAAERDISMTA